MRKTRSGTMVPVWVLLGLVAVAVSAVVIPLAFGNLPNLPNGIFAPREPETAIPLPSSTVAPVLTATSTVVPTVTPSATPTQTPTSTVTFTPTATPYVFTDTIEDAWYISELIGEPVVTGSRCVDRPYEFSKYILSNGDCFQDLGEHDRNEVLAGPYYLGLFNEMSPDLRFVGVHFYVFRQDGSYTHFVDPSEFWWYLGGGQLVRSKDGQNYVTTFLGWSISAEVYEKLAKLGREFDGYYWYDLQP